MRTKTKITRNPKRRELIVERKVAIPRNLAWQGWTRREHIVHWWGPREWTATVYEMDVKPAGVWRYSLTSNEEMGEKTYCKAIYREVIEPTKLVYTDTFTDKDWNVVEGSDMYTTVTFLEVSGGTKLSIITHFANIEDLKAAEGMGMIDGFKDTIDRLEEYLSTHL
ncbi:SRPBCC domain-containing protein [Cytobacillus purgationiresistens]|uniref:Uncharacterized protein YndB with AHSA1/START domain n=1 Tax=Cytobacillus purgationiresistens TaxID=863449 RepID=A0ABU0AD46_9BACI|nr:SRPBCC domain-containing protein [Cytobacillus purgationiresistens]MDQ0268641.1 uncharacterized protein YndB with AHSA1/START domain [Cytobacillus purgationiresistens]